MVLQYLNGLSCLPLFLPQFLHVCLVFEEGKLAPVAEAGLQHLHLIDAFEIPGESNTNVFKASGPQKKQGPKMYLKINVRISPVEKLMCLFL